MEILIIVLLILFNGFLSMSEFALVSSRKLKLETAAKQGKKGAIKALKLLEKPDNFLSTIQMGITFIGILTGVYSGDTISQYIKDWFSSFPSVALYAGLIANTIVVLVITYFTIVLGELLPKKIGLLFPDKIIQKTSGFMCFFSKLFFPFTWMLTKTVHIIMKALNITNTEENKITEQEILAAIKQGTYEGEIKEVEQDIVERVFDLGDRDVESLMTYRNELICIDINDSIENIHQIIYNHMHSYYPVIDGNLDKIMGVVYLRDLFDCLSKDNFDLQNYIHKPQYIPETTSSYNVLKLFKESKIYYAFIIDEFGSLQGMVTAVDIMEALVGKISHLSKDEETIIQLSDKTWLADGQYPFYDFLSYFEMEDLFPENDYNTLSGLILELTEHIPEVEEKIVWKNFEFQIKAMDDARIDKVLVNKNINDENNNED
ncbi:MAG: hemolysin family protein [Bacteroidales bacterium]|jgi:putative hemolysin|nr:hemolysin family protein [Bacteroidales bacterium]MDD2686923.1 hemolysin family protein [Bacteroidales bacterium]MDD3330050.1 hemolysin family protein [Bacteroidales bacterium]MDD3690856.1 hemolysin family protein [Bacteroidales bacterium]MDD4044144.1 hemolysin family protein [Bacteroidales bacterium]